MPFTPVEVIILTPTVLGVEERQGSLIDWPAGATAVDAFGLLSDGDLSAEGKSAQITLIESFDGGQTIQRGPSTLWNSGQLELHSDTVYTPPNIGAGYANSGVFPDKTSAIIAPTSPMSIGLKLVFS